MKFYEVMQPNSLELHHGLISEGYSNVNDLTTRTLNFFDTNLDTIIDKIRTKGKAKFTVPLNPTTSNVLTVYMADQWTKPMKELTGSSGFAGPDTKGWGNYRILMHFSPDDPETARGLLTHEVTHVSQIQNGFAEYDRNQDASRRERYRAMNDEDVSGMSSSDFYNGISHSERGTEHEAEMIRLFSQISKGHYRSALNHVMRTYGAYIQMDRKTFFKKAASFGLTRSVLVDFKTNIEDVLLRLEQWTTTSPDYAAYHALWAVQNLVCLCDIFRISQFDRVLTAIGERAIHAYQQSKSDAKYIDRISRRIQFILTKRRVPEFSGSSAPISLNIPASVIFERQIPSDTTFDAWFGNSKVVDADGKPLVVYHGTSKPAFDRFKLPGNNGTGGNAIFFATNPDDASNFARFGGHVLPCYVRMENPFDYNNPEHIDRLAVFIEKNFSKIFSGALYGPQTAIRYLRNGDFSILEKPTVRAWMRRNKFDGFWTREQTWGKPTLAVFDPHQIKSAVSNTGMYNRDDPRISEGINTEDCLTQ